MKQVSVKCLIYSAVCGLMLSGVPVVADQTVPVQVAAKVVDVQLEAEGTLSGAVVNVAARPVSGSAVRVIHGDKVVATAVSDGKGHFAVQGLRSGTHVIQCGGSQQTVRFWGADTAPPNSVSKLAVVVDQHGSVRGQEGGLGGALVPLGVFGVVLGTTLVTTLGADDPAPASP